MKILLVGINSRFTHTNLALRYMRESLLKKNYSVDLKEYTINNELDYILGDLIYRDYDYICFSTYIWNIKEIEKICEVIKKSKKEIKTIFGGPEVTYNSKEYLLEFPFVDFVIKGEGEEVLPRLINSLENKLNLEKINGIIYRDNGKILENPGINKIIDIENLPFPYETEYSSKNKKEAFKNKYIYYETTRGCPYRCGFCLSSRDNGIRAMSMERIKDDLDKIYQLEPLIIKFVDRTFNYDWKRSREIISYIASKDSSIKVHYEITADIINLDFLEFLKKLPENIFQFEIGLQTTNEYTLNEIHRKMDFENIKLVVKELSKTKNIHLHLDLIAGLPKENYQSFINSFNDAYKLGAEKLQLGFLKVLKGTSVYNRREENGLVYRSFPPYEIIKTNDIKALEIQKLKKVDIILNKYYSEGYFSNTVNYILENYYDNPYEFYLDMSDFWEKEGYFSKYHKRKKLYDILFHFSQEKGYGDHILNEKLALDYVKNNRNLELPTYLNKDREDKLKIYKRLISRDEFFINKYFQDIYEKLKGKIINEFRIVEINDTPNLFVYKEDNCYIYDIKEELDNMRKDD
ncbi:MAG: radical SAM protein [Bacillota bacterium]|nr:radical SAM protein [Bacillota bacterium]